MKKALSIALVLLMIVSMGTAALAETWVHEASGITIEVPEGMAAEDLSEEGFIMLYLENTEEENSNFHYITIEYSEELEGVWLEDLDEEDVMEIAAYFASEDLAYNYETMVTNTDITVLVMAEEEASQVMVIALLNGWLIAVDVTAPEGYQLAEGALDDLIALLAAVTLPAA